MILQGSGTYRGCFISVIWVCEPTDIRDDSELSSAETAMTGSAQIPHVLQTIDAIRSWCQSHDFQRSRRLRPVEELDEFPEVDGLGVFDGVRDDVGDFAHIYRVADLAAWIAEGALATDLLRAVGGLEGWAVEFLAFAGARGAGAGFWDAAAAEGSECLQSFFDDVDEIFDSAVGSFIR